MIGQANIWPGKCHDDKPLHYTPENTGVKHDDTHSYHEGSEFCDSSSTVKKMHKL